MTLYEMNQAAYSKAHAMDEEEILRATEKLQKFLFKHNSKYYLMLNVEGRYYTIYTYKEEPNIEKMAYEMVDVAKTLGTIKGIEFEKDMVEFWIQKTDTCEMYAVFDYSRGVIEI